MIRQQLIEKAKSSNSYHKDGVNILSDFYDFVETEPTNIAKQVFKFLDKDGVKGIMLYDNVYWIETLSYVTVPDYVNKYIKTFLKPFGIKWLYEQYEKREYKPSIRSRNGFTTF